MGAKEQPFAFLSSRFSSLPGGRLGRTKSGDGGMWSGVVCRSAAGEGWSNGSRGLC